MVIIEIIKLYIDENKMNLVEHTILPSRCFSNKVLVDWIRQGKLDWIEEGLFHRFGTPEKPAKRPNNSDKLLTAFVIYFEDIEHRQDHNLQDLLHILHVLIQYYLSFPVYWSDDITVSLFEKKKILLNLVFISGYVSFVEYTIHFLIVHEQETAKKEKRKLNYHFLKWSSYSRDKEVYRKAHIYPISSKFEHSCMSYMLLHYTGEDPDLLAMMRQIYKEESYVFERRMSVFSLE